MAIIIETCPKCGHDLHDLVIATYPPIPKKVCPSCGWSWVGEPEEIIRMPFGGNSLIVDDLVSLENYTTFKLEGLDLNVIKPEDYTLLGNDCTIISGTINFNELKHGF